MPYKSLQVAKEYRRNYYLKHLEEKKSTQKVYYAKHRTKVLAQQREHRMVFKDIYNKKAAERGRRVYWKGRLPLKAIGIFDKNKLIDVICDDYTVSDGPDAAARANQTYGKPYTIREVVIQKVLVP